MQIGKERLSPFYNFTFLFIMSSLSQQELLQRLPKVDEGISLVLACRDSLPFSLVKKVVQQEIARERQAILAGDSPVLLEPSDWQQRFLTAIDKKMAPRLKRVFNGTGVVIHTNLGRSILSENMLSFLLRAGGYYSNLEFDLVSGKRGSRYSLVEELLCELTGAEAALVVNNNAAAVLLALDTLAKGKEVIVSRGQLVEIGGSFRIPDIMAKSGAQLVEVGATNRTHIYDYENALTDNTGMLLRVHTSNFRIIGFTADVSGKELAALARKNNLVSMEDLGSGSLVDLSRYGFPYEPTVQDVVDTGIDVVTFSGDKLLGGPQAGIIVGKKEIVDSIRRNPLNRALRVDKLTLASLEAVLREYYTAADAVEAVPTLKMLTQPAAAVRKRAELLCALLDRAGESVALSIIAVESRVGGGALPEHDIASWAVALAPKNISVPALEIVLRNYETPVIGRIENDLFLLDMRTIAQDEVAALAEILLDVFCH